MNPPDREVHISATPFVLAHAMALDKEKQILLLPRGQARSRGGRHTAGTPEEGQRNAIQVRLKNLVIAGLVELFVRSDLHPPQCLSI